jgi:hypothetical protein
VCRKISRSADHLDAYITGRTITLLNSPRFLYDLDSAGDEGPSVAAQIATLQRRRAETQAKLENLADFPDLDPGVVAVSLASFDRKVRQLRDQLAVSAQHRLLVRMAGVTPGQWSAEPIEVRSATVKALFRITILPATRRGPGFDPASVDLRRRPLSQADIDGSEGRQAEVEA